MRTQVFLAWVIENNGQSHYFVSLQRSFATLPLQIFIELVTGFKKRSQIQTTFLLKGISSLSPLIWNDHPHSLQ